MPSFITLTVIKKICNITKCLVGSFSFGDVEAVDSSVSITVLKEWTINIRD